MTETEAPKPLPPTLPAGTRTTGGCVALETWELRDGEYVGMTRWPNGTLKDQVGHTYPGGVDWSTYNPAQPETDEQWCERRILELFGHRVQVYRWSCYYEAKPPSGVSVAHWYRECNLCIGDHVAIANRDDSMIRSAVVHGWGWPIKDSPAGVGSTGRSSPGREHPAPGNFRNDPSNGKPQGAASAETSEPTLAEATGYCLECRAPMKARPGREVCRYCDLRCGGYSDPPPHEAMRRREESARQRMALMDEREKPRPSRWSRELERAHPWTAEDET